MNQLIVIALFFVSFSASAFNDLYGNPVNGSQVAPGIYLNPADDPNYYYGRQQSQERKELQMLQESNDMQREQLNMQREREHDEAFRRAGVPGY